MPTNTLRDLCPLTDSFINASSEAAAISRLPDGEEAILAFVREAASQGLAPFFAPDICDLELALRRVARKPAEHPGTPDGMAVNPGLEIRVLESTGCAGLLARMDEPAPAPVAGREMVMVWRRAGSRTAVAEPARPEDLAILKVIGEGIDPAIAEELAQVEPGLIRKLLRAALDKGIILPPPSRIRRDTGDVSNGRPLPEEAVAAETFTLQWHLTQACDLSCRHCYDRSSRADLPLVRAMDIIADFQTFCRDRNVAGQISLSGGNPLLYPHFHEVYARAAGAGFSLAILGNPASRVDMDAILRIARPVYYQVSLEGLPEHNDSIRGPGHFRRVMEFLDLLLELDVQGQVMLTLTRDNMAQVLPLAEMLAGRVWGLSFNRLSPVGRGAALALPDPSAFRDFTAAYCEAAARLNVLSFKDNMLNVRLAETGRPTFGGCTGFGCGAAFNFMALLPDGEVHACRKFPSLIGNIAASTLADIYDGSAASSYRKRSLACQGCAITAVCGGCPAVVSGLGLDISTDRDPYCPGQIIGPDAPDIATGNAS
jgi:selenobiotic family peptide radical SAM maturase